MDESSQCAASQSCVWYCRCLHSFSIVLQSWSSVQQLCMSCPLTRRCTWDDKNALLFHCCCYTSALTAIWCIWKLLLRIYRSHDVCAVKSVHCCVDNRSQELIIWATWIQGEDDDSTWAISTHDHDEWKRRQSNDDMSFFDITSMLLGSSSREQSLRHTKISSLHQVVMSR